VRVRADLGLLTGSREEELASARKEKEALLALARAEGVLPAEPPPSRSDRSTPSRSDRSTPSRSDRSTPSRSDRSTPSRSDRSTESLSQAEVATALHLLLARSPSRLVVAALGDAVGDVRQPNLPGTTDEYPNWRLPVADSTGRPMSLEELESDARVRALADALRDGVTGRTQA
jgi:4-alpha-glucanotransferase